MTKRKSKPTIVEELTEDLESVAVEIEEAANEITKSEEKTKEDADESEVERKRCELIRLCEDGEIDKPSKYIRKANRKIIEKIYREHDRNRQRKANEFLTDLIISKFASVLGGVDAIESPEDLKSELSRDELLRRDVYKAADTITPYIPLMGLLSGGVITAKHVAK